MTHAMLIRLLSHAFRTSGIRSFHFNERNTKLAAHFTFTGDWHKACALLELLDIPYHHKPGTATVCPSIILEL